MTWKTCDGCCNYGCKYLPLSLSTRRYECAEMRAEAEEELENIEKYMKAEGASFLKGQTELQKQIAELQNQIAEAPNSTAEVTKIAELEAKLSFAEKFIAEYETGPGEHDVWYAYVDAKSLTRK